MVGLKLLVLSLTLLLLLFPKSVLADSVIDNKVITLINNERSKQNLPTLSSSDKLNQASTEHNKKMYDCSIKFGVDSCFVHQVTQLGEDTLMNRINQTNYSATAVGEIIAWGYRTPETAVVGWMNSSGHRSIILSSSYKDIGCNFYTSNFWTCDFGKSSKPQPSNSPSVSPSSSPSQKPSVNPSIIPSASPTPVGSISPVPSSKPWYCVYFPTISQCR